MYTACIQFRNKKLEKRRPGAAHFYVEGDAGPDGCCDAGSGSRTAAGQQFSEKVDIRLMIQILHDLKDPKLWEFWNIPYYG